MTTNLPSFDIDAGEGATVYGDWSDTHGYQFIVMWGHSAGIPVHVIILGGTDYGGGVVVHAKVPYKELMDILKKHENDTHGYDLFVEVQELVLLCK